MAITPYCQLVIAVQRFQTRATSPVKEVEGQDQGVTAVRSFLKRSFQKIRTSKTKLVMLLYVVIMILSVFNINFCLDRPESSLTVASECSSTISSSDENEEDRPVSPKSNISDDESQKPQVKTEKQVKTNDEKNNSNGVSRLSNLIQSMKIPKFKRQKSNNSEVSSSSSTSPDLDLPPKPVRSRSISSEQGGLVSPFSRNVSERHSYRTQSRYMQAAEAYAAKRRNNNSTNGTWSGSRGRERSTILPDKSNVYDRPSSRASSLGGKRIPSRTASASPGPQRRIRKDVTKNLQVPNPTPSSKSTPTRKPGKTENAKYDDDEGDEILKRMEEILMTYKSKVEDHLAAEGRELPKELFEDFTTQWVNEATTLTKSRSSSRHRNESEVVKVRTAPNWRRETNGNSAGRSGRERTRIPVPTFFNSPIPNETHI